MKLFSLPGLRWHVVFLIICLVNPAWSWNAVGHRVIAQIAYDHLNPNTKRLLQNYNKAFNTTQRHKDSLVMSAVWFDRLYSKEYANFKPMHYIDLAFTDESLPLPKLNPNNAVTAMSTMMHRLQDPNASLAEKGMALRIILHVVGDIHQPLHAITKVSHNYPQGDRGGNLVLLQKNRVAPNLHAYWDRGAGLWSTHRHYSSKQIKIIAKRLESKYPCSLTKNTDLDPMHWALESHQIAINLAYHALPSSNQPSIAYQQNAQQQSQERVALAGCRLANLLNSAKI